LIPEINQVAKHPEVAAGNTTAEKVKPNSNEESAST